MSSCESFPGAKPGRRSILMLETTRPGGLEAMGSLQPVAAGTGLLRLFPAQHPRPYTSDPLKPDGPEMMQCEPAVLAKLLAELLGDEHGSGTGQVHEPAGEVDRRTEQIAFPGEDRPTGQPSTGVGHGA